MVELVQSTAGQTDVQAVVHLGQVRDLTRGTEVTAVTLRILGALQHPGLAGRAVPVVDGDGLVRHSLLVGADLAHFPGVGHRVQSGQVDQLAEGLAKDSKHETEQNYH